MPSVDEDVGLVELAYIFDRNTKRTITLENSLVIPYKHNPFHIPAIPLLGIYQEKKNALHKVLYMSIYSISK